MPVPTARRDAEHCELSETAMAQLRTIASVIGVQPTLARRRCTSTTKYSSAFRRSLALARNGHATLVEMRERVRQAGAQLRLTAISCAVELANEQVRLHEQACEQIAACVAAGGDVRRTADSAFARLACLKPLIGLCTRLVHAAERDEPEGRPDLAVTGPARRAHGGRKRARRATDQPCDCAENCLQLDCPCVLACVRCDTLCMCKPTCRRTTKSDRAVRLLHELRENTDATSSDEDDDDDDDES